MLEINGDVRWDAVPLDAVSNQTVATIKDVFRKFALDTQEPRHDGCILLSRDGPLWLRSAKGVDVVAPNCAVWVPKGVAWSVRAFALTYSIAVDDSSPVDSNGKVIVQADALLQELIIALSGPACATVGGDSSASFARRRALILPLLQSEIPRGKPLSLSVEMPVVGRHRVELHWLCERALVDPSTSFEAHAKDVGFSARTATRLFSEELATSWRRWREGVLLAHALPMLWQGMGVGQVAEACGYSSASAFGSMFRSRIGCSPTQCLQTSGTA